MVVLVLVLIFCSIALLVALGPIIAVLLGIGTILVAMFLFGLEGDLIESLESRGGRASVAEVLGDSGIAVSARSECVFATCRIYGKLDDLLDDGDLIVLGSEQRILRSDQLLLLRQE